MSLHKPEAIKPLKGFRLWVRFSDGVEGVADLSDIAGRGVFARWTRDYAAFESVQIAGSGELIFEGDLDVCSDAIYFDLKKETSAQPATAACA